MHQNDDLGLKPPESVTLFQSVTTGTLSLLLVQNKTLSPLSNSSHYLFYNLINSIKFDILFEYFQRNEYAHIYT